MDNNEQYTVKAYKIAYSDDGKNWTDYKTYGGEIRVSFYFLFVVVCIAEVLKISFTSSEMPPHPAIMLSCRWY